MAAPAFPGITPSGDTRCPVWCVECSPEICHRSYGIELDLGEVTISLSVHQWRNGYPDGLLPGWAPAHVSYGVTHKIETIDFGYGPGEPVIIRASDPIALGVCFGADPVAVRKFIAAQAELLALIERDGGGHV